MADNIRNGHTKIFDEENKNVCGKLIYKSKGMKQKINANIETMAQSTKDVTCGVFSQLEGEADKPGLRENNEKKLNTW